MAKGTAGLPGSTGGFTGGKVPTIGTSIAPKSAPGGPGPVATPPAAGKVLGADDSSHVAPSQAKG